jgi:hypothetical protein
MAFNPQGQVYKPDPLADTGTTQKPFQEANVPKTGGIVNTLLRLAMRRMPAMGFGAVHGNAPKGVGTPKDAMKMGSHGTTNPTGSF